MSARQAARMDMGLCKCIQEDWVEFAKKNANRLPNGREDSIEVSNLGNVSLNTLCGGWNVKGLWFAQGRKVTRPSTHFYNGVVDGWTQGCFECSASNI